MQADKVASMIRKYRGHLALWIIGVGAALLAPLLLRWLGVARQIDAECEALGFDTERVLLIDHLLLTFLGSCLVGLLFQRRSSAWMGSVIAFVLGYLVPFVQQALRPGLGPDGRLQVLMPGALSSVVLTMLALSILFAG